MVKTGQFATKCKDDRHRSKMADITSVGLKFKIFTTGTGRCVIVPNVMSVGQTIAEIWPFFDFSRWWFFAMLDF